MHLLGGPAAARRRAAGRRAVPANGRAGCGPGRRGSITFNSLAKTTLQLAAKPTMRGQVMALWALAWLGSTPIGGPIMGWVAQETGARWSLVVGGAAALLSGALALPAMLRMESRLAASPAAEPLAAEPPAAEPLAAVSEPPEAEPPAAEPEPATATANLP